ncbi:substrate-binding domain-containing protein [Butyrivibrio fibrisolvens]|uniref:substrate-binding domain-containing protein n=1 Tax=Pseudobutyrivibrio ruminis TaxID=46206 RepID=UPI0003F807A9|nr:substrate-binding domain-containing protein [Pseudobutyrivibrio ruminis]MDC7279643.1 substrate-binding domain-containing protein [Butyrivibrio fibrisolvens]
MKNRRWIMLFFAAVGILLLAEAIIYMSYSNKEKGPFTITFVVDSEELQDYENMKAGATNAAMDNNCIIDFVSSSREDKVDSDEVVTVENNSLYYSKGTLTVDKEAMVSELAERVIASENCDRILLVSSGETDKYQKIIDLFKAGFDEAGRYVEYRPLSTDEKKLKQSMYNLEQSGLFDCFIALDKESIEAACEANNRANRFVVIYGMDNSSEAVYYLDNGGLEALAYEDEYSLGYIAVRQLLKDREIKKVSENRTFYYIADRESMYSAELEKVLFPFVK